MKMIDNILITELGFRTTTHDRCIYLQERDGEIQLLLRQVDNFVLRTTRKKATRDLFNNIGIKIHSVGVVKDYNRFNIRQTPDYIKMLSKSYII